MSTAIAIGACAVALIGGFFITFWWGGRQAKKAANVAIKRAADEAEQRAKNMRIEAGCRDEELRTQGLPKDELVAGMDDFARRMLSIDTPNSGAKK